MSDPRPPAVAPTTVSVTEAPPPTSSVLSAIVAFGSWGVLPIYWKALGGVGSDIAIAHRVVWTMVTVVPLLIWLGEWRGWVQALQRPAIVGAHAWSGLLLGINWGVFVWAAQHGHILDSSLGYFINPLLNVLIGRFLLGEQLSRLQFWSITLAACGVALQIVLLGRVPWIGLLLAVSFALYALARRKSPLGSLSGLGVETLVGLPFAAAYLLWVGWQGAPLFGHGTGNEIALVVGLGVITTIPLLGFAHGAWTLPFALLGLLQFLAPTGQFIVAAFVYHEPVKLGTLGSFALIWAGVIAFCLDLWVRGRRKAGD